MRQYVCTAYTVGLQEFWTDWLPLEIPFFMTTNVEPRSWSLPLESWSAYVDGLLGGANSEPFYTGDEKKSIEAAFFADAAVREQLVVSPVVAGGAAFFHDGKNWTTFWKESLTEPKAGLDVLW